MMKLQTISANCNVVHFGERSILFSYQTPVAVWLRESMHGLPVGFYRTDLYHSRTTSRHLNSWVVTDKPDVWKTVSQTMINTIANGR